MLTSLFTSTLLYLSLVGLIINPKVGFELRLFTKQTNINNFFLELLINNLVHYSPNFW